MKKTNVKKLTLTAIFVAVSVVGSMFSFPVGSAKCAPIQHLMNIMGAVFLGPGWTVAAAFAASVLRNLMGLGSLMAFPGSMCGALLAGLLYRWFKNLPLTYLGEVFGTGIIGGLLAYPVAKLLMGVDAAAFAYIVPFLISTVGGTVIAAVLVTALKKSGVVDRLLEEGSGAGSVETR